MRHRPVGSKYNAQSAAAVALMPLLIFAANTAAEGGAVAQRVERWTCYQHVVG